MNQKNSLNQNIERNAPAIGPSGLNAAEGRDIEVLRTYLSMSRPEQLRRGSTPDPAQQPFAVRLASCTVAEWRQLYAEVGAPWQWHDRDEWSDEAIAERLNASTISVYRVEATVHGERVALAGFFEIEQHADGSAEIVYLGLHPRVFGLGLGAWLVGEAVDRAFGPAPSRVWLHTCSLDAPAALPNYLARGFVIERTERYVTPRHG